jgi:DNA-directed RNA polymerase subunit M/transcription elongation factor TFIIS
MDIKELNEKVEKNKYGLYEHGIKLRSFTHRYCPKCKKHEPMVIFDESYADYPISREQYRCLKCLTLWDEYEGKVNETV